MMNLKDFIEFEIDELKEILEEEPDNQLVKDKIKQKEEELKDYLRRKYEYT